jgi:hypothetical protein
MPAASHGQRQLVLARKVDRGNHIGDIFASGDQRGVLVDHGIVDEAGLLVASIAGAKQRAAQARCQLLDRRFLQSDWGGLLFLHTFLLINVVV